jgi:metal-responsive CopG/Arc/MetJ family transcriptional regulator
MKKLLPAKRRRVALSISLPPEIARDYEVLARRLAKNKSQLFREMFQAYRENAVKSEFFDLQRYGAATARKKGIFTEKDVERLVFEGR